MGDRKNKPTYERLYELNKAKLNKQTQEVMNTGQNSQSKFDYQQSKDIKVPVVSEKEMESHERDLNEYANKRRHDLQKIKEKQDQKKETVATFDKKFKNTNTDKIVMEKFERELKQVEQELNEQE